MSSYRVLKTVSILVLSVFWACTVTELDQDGIAEPIEVSLEPYISRLVTVNAVAGDDTLTLLFDTGGGDTFLGPDVAQSLGCIPSGRSVGFRMSGEMVKSQHCNDITLSIGGVFFPHESIGVWDINSILPEGLPRLDGILSLKTFQNQPFTLDLSSKRLILETTQSLKDRTNTMTRLKSRIATGPCGRELDIFIQVKIKNQDYGWFLLDSGNLDVVIVASHIAENNLADSTISSGIWESELMLGNFEMVSTRFRTKEIIYDGALSEEFMSKWVFTFDLSNNAVWASPVKDSLSE